MSLPYVKWNVAYVEGELICQPNEVMPTEFPHNIRI